MELHVRLYLVSLALAGTIVLGYLLGHVWADAMGMPGGENLGN
jgi:hypothetical protein